jgi:hypothetical protein
MQNLLEDGTMNIQSYMKAFSQELDMSSAFVVAQLSGLANYNHPFHHQT